MNILAIHQSSDLYGSDRSFLSVIQALEKEDQNLTIILPNKGPLSKILEQEGLNIVYRSDGYLRKSILNNPLLFLLKSWKEFKWLSKEFKKYDLIYVNTVVCFSAILSLIFFKKKKIIHVREIPTGVLMFFFRLLLKMSGSKLIYNSKATMDAFKINGNVIYNGVNPKKSNVQIESVGNFAKLLIVGRINTWKGHELLLKSMNLTNQIFHLKIVGNTIESQQYLQNNLQEYVDKELKNKGHLVEFCGFSDDVSKYYSWCDYVIVPSIKPEPFGRVAIEALSYGKPVIASKCGGLVEIIQDGLNGFLFETNSEVALSKVIDNLPENHSIQYISMSQQACKVFTEKFSEDGYKKNMVRTILN